jgi:hypothetical protein
MASVRSFSSCPVSAGRAYHLSTAFVSQLQKDTFVKTGHGNLLYGYSFMLLTTVIAIVVGSMSHTLPKRGLAEHTKN